MFNHRIFKIFIDIYSSIKTCSILLVFLWILSTVSHLITFIYGLMEQLHYTSLSVKMNLTCMYVN